ncbi:GH92 family glycosyl hydrolase [Dyella psychrodurans]|uniref:Glycoside hydrolase family 92 protein n=1 Tax=Dyella psychrodurans TaxID=1927960 RepID=A0A370XAT1_9GAMM|nr:GH92 family glycosyl hydrolase [Dyella psychrodurans]RDS85381.1 glycoside hydrolase family 92 protein [Dyella psychrodurans]
MHKAPGNTKRLFRQNFIFAALALFTTLVCADQNDTFYRSFEAGEPAPIASHAGDAFAIEVGGGPSAADAYTAKPGVGFSGLHSLHYHGDAGGKQGAAVFDVDIPVQADTQLSYLLFPCIVANDLRDPSTYVAIDLVFDDGSRLSATDARDQHRIPANANALGASRTVYVNQWNKLSVDIGHVANGRRIRHIVLEHNGPGAHFEGFLDDLRIGPAPQQTSDQHPSDDVYTLRGTNSGYVFSRGNNVPAVTLPHGFNFWAPVTDASSDWMYQYQERNDANNRPRIEAFSLSHEPSPWMGDRQTFQLMPAAVASGAPSANRAARALSFSHANEIAHAHYYKVTFDNGIVGEMTPTDHAAALRFTFPGKRGQLVFDNRTDEGSITLDPAHRSFSGYSDVKSRLSTGATRLFFYATVDQAVSESGRLTGEGRDHVTAWFGFDTSKNRTVNVRMATSLISLDQAKRNLAMEIGAHDSFDDVRDKAQQIWDKQLSIVKVQGASRDERVTLYSNLYRLLMYPNSAYENTGTVDKPVYQYASPFSPEVGTDTPTHTGARIVNGKVFVNNGFWDTYRTAWPLYTLLMPQQAGTMIDGFVQEYRDSGWIARWSSPGYADLMVGTSADVAFADAWLKGVHNFDVSSFYQAALKDATVVSPLAGTGRKGLQRSIFNGYTDTGIKEGFSWSMDGYIADFAIGNLAEALAKQHDASDPYNAQYAVDAHYFLDRALDYVNLFNPGIGFFVGRDASGQWRYTKQNFDPLRWGDDYTETDGWNMAFHAPQDGAGLAALYGGRAELAAKLDQFFATPGIYHVGGYGEPIHEMREAQAVRMGQYGHSNQPSHHIIYMYDYAGEPWKAQDKVRDVLSRLYLGSEIGQGYLGDEDNGEMSGWWLFSAAGFYPLRMGTPEYVIGAPYFPHMDIALENGKHIVINALEVSDTNRYVQSLRVNGQPWNKLTLPHALLAEGATLDFTMGPKPSRWGSDEQALPPSLSTTGAPSPMHDLVGPGQGTPRSEPEISNLNALFDHSSDTEAPLPRAQSIVSWQFLQPRTVAMYTLTSATQAQAPSDWTLEASDDGQHWTVLETRKNERFPWARQTRAFDIGNPGQHRYYRFRFDNEAPTALAEIALLGR